MVAAPRSFRCRDCKGRFPPYAAKVVVDGGWVVCGDCQYMRELGDRGQLIPVPRIRDEVRSEQLDLFHGEGSR